MTTTDPASYQYAIENWIEHLVPRQMRDEGAELLSELQRIRRQIIPLLPRLEALFDWRQHATNRADKAVRDVAGPEAEHDLSDGILSIVGTLAHTAELYAILTDLGLDPDDLGNAAKVLGEVEG